jgi:hypothetical protein
MTLLQRANGAQNVGVAGFFRRNLRNLSFATSANPLLFAILYIPIFQL